MARKTKDIEKEIVTIEKKIENMKLKITDEKAKIRRLKKELLLSEKEELWQLVRNTDLPISEVRKLIYIAKEKKNENKDNKENNSY